MSKIYFNMIFLLFLFFIIFQIAKGDGEDEAECKWRNSKVECQKQNGCIWKGLSCSLCQAFANSEMHVLCDQVCLACHEMFSDREPNTRADCSENCYKNGKFRACLAIFPHSNMRALAFARMRSMMEEDRAEEEE